jgi:hypothetical protein
MQTQKGCMSWLISSIDDDNNKQQRVKESRSTLRLVLLSAFIIIMPRESIEAVKNVDGGCETIRGRYFFLNSSEIKRQGAAEAMQRREQPKEI